MDIAALKAELLSGHPDTGAYDVDDTIAAGQGNLENRPHIRESMSGDDVFQQTDETEFAGLSTEKKQLWLAFCGRDQINPSKAANIDFVKWVFGDPSSTLNNLVAARIEQISRFVEQELGFVKAGHVQQARA